MAGKDSSSIHYQYTKNTKGPPQFAQSRLCRSSELCSAFSFNPCTYTQELHLHILLEQRFGGFPGLSGAQKISLLFFSAKQKQVIFTHCSRRVRRKANFTGFSLLCCKRRQEDVAQPKNGASFSSQKYFHPPL